MSETSVNTNRYSVEEQSNISIWILSFVPILDLGFFIKLLKSFQKQYQIYTFDDRKIFIHMNNNIQQNGY